MIHSETKAINADISIPENYKIWPFELSKFQKDAVYSIYNGNDTLVCAPTGSGKTLPAEFAIYYFNESGKKVIYTTPVKALSNEKFHDLSKKFPDISFGLLTGDNKFNPEADVVIMTTEILLNTLNKLQSLNCKEDKIKNAITKTLDFEINLDELGAVIFDEIHYINDPDRGSVWEKSIMNLPKNTIYVGLSATIDGPERLCSWSSTPKPMGAGRNKINLCETTHRNVPLEHYSFLSLPDSNFKKMSPQTNNIMEEFLNKPILLKKQNEPFNEKTYDKMKKIFKYVDDNKIFVKPAFMFNKMINYLYENSLLPAIAFVFSRKQCHVWANMVNKSLFKEGSTTPSIIKKKATQILISKLPNWKEYTELLEFKNIVKLLEKGIAVHHSGVTPVFREMIELLFKEGMIRLLIATETFAIGINMGIKCCIFTSLQKYDGRKFRFLLSHEYGQAAGRAGRRGKDKKGIVFHLNMLYNSRNSNPDNITYRSMMSGNPQKLISKFKIDFNLVLSLLNTNVDNFSDFVNSSMLSCEMNKEKQVVENNLTETIKRYEILKDNLNYLFTNIETVENYIQLKQKEKFTTNRKKKNKITREIDNLIQTHKHLLKDVEKYEKINNTSNEIDKLQKTIQNIDNYVNNEIYLHIDILKNNGFVENKNDDDKLILTIKGEMAANIHEIHSLAMAELIYKGCFDHLTVEEIISSLSVFQDIKLSDDEKYHSINSCNINDNIKNTIRIIEKTLSKYYDIETKHQTNFTQSYDIQYDMCEFMFNWCYADEMKCKQIYSEAKKYNIYTGEFIKAILKLVNITNELEKICIISENISLLQKISLVKDKVLKSIATNQSLYL